jgi:hypothetical protein
MTDKICVVFVCSLEYYHKFLITCQLLLTKGCYKGDILLMIGDDLYNKDTGECKIQDAFLLSNNIKVLYFPDYKFNEVFLEKQNNLPRDHFWYEKRFQYHKFHLFDPFFKQWDYILYMDCGIQIFSDITPILEERTKNTLLANRDGVDGETAAWCIPETPNEGLKIGDQFIKTDPLYEELKVQYNMKLPYFQTTVMLYDTSIITENTKSDLYELLLKYPISVTNDQGIIALYFTQEKPHWKQLRRKNEDTYYYDYVRCAFANYIMVKSMDTNFLHIGYRS